MTQALMDLGSRLDLKPVGGPGESRRTADSGAAFADAVDQAVSEFRVRSDARNESDRDDDRRASDALGPRDGDDHGDPEPADAAATPIWAPIPQDLHAAHVPSGGKDGRPGDQLDVADVTAHPPRRADTGDDTDTGAANRGAAATTRGTISTAPGQHTAVSAVTSAQHTAVPAGQHTAVSAFQHTAVSAAKAGDDDARLIGTAVDGTSRAGSPTAGTAVDGTKVATNTARPATAATTGAIGAQYRAPSPTADRAKATTRGDAGGTATAATDAAAPALTPAHAVAGSARSDLAAGGHTNAAETGDEARPGPSENAASKRVGAQGAAHASVNAIAHASENSAVKSAVNSIGNSATSAATDAAASQVSPTTMHVPTAVGATVNSTPVAATTPLPTPFTQAQPDVANILAQLRGRSDGTYQLRAQVHPAELGAVSITATVHQGALTLTLTPDQAAQQAISQSLPQLRQHLADQGFTGVNVGLGSPDQSGQHGQGSGDRRSRAQGSDHSSLHGPDAAIGAAEHASARRAAGTPSALDLML